MFALFPPVRKAAKAAIAGLALLALAACDVVSVGPISGGPSINTNRPVPVALLIPASEPGAAGVAQSLENAARLAVADLGPDVQIDLRVYDTAGSAQLAGGVAQAAIDDGAKIIIGPLFAEAANAAGVAAANDGVNVLSFSNNPSIAGGNVFILGNTFDNSAQRLMRYAASQGKSSVTVVHPQNVEGEFARTAVVSAANRAGLTVRAVEGFEVSQQGVVNAIPAIRSAAGDSDTVFLTSSSAGALPFLLQLLPEAGLGTDTTQYVGLTDWSVPAQNTALPGAQNGWFAVPDRGRLQAFSSRYQASYGVAPHPLGGLAYDGIAAIGALVKAGQSDALTAGALTQAAGFQGTGGIFRFLPNGTNQRGLAVATIRERQVVVIDPAPASFGGAGF